MLVLQAWGLEFNTCFLSEICGGEGRQIPGLNGLPRLINLGLSERPYLKPDSTQPNPTQRNPTQSIPTQPNQTKPNQTHPKETQPNPIQPNQTKEWMTYSSFISLSAIQHSDQKQLREQRVYLVQILVTVHLQGNQGSQGKILSRNLKQKLWKNTVCQLALCLCLARFLIQPRTICTGNRIAYTGLGPPTLINN